MQQQNIENVCHKRILVEGIADIKYGEINKLKHLNKREFVQIKKDSG